MNFYSDILIYLRSCPGISKQTESKGLCQLTNLILLVNRLSYALYWCQSNLIKTKKAQIDISIRHFDNPRKSHFYRSKLLIENFKYYIDAQLKNGLRSLH